MLKPAKTWRVRVQRKIEDWVDVEADSADEANLKALQLPGILNVFTLNTIRGDRPVGTVVSKKQSVEDDEE